MATNSDKNKLEQDYAESSVAGGFTKALTELSERYDVVDACCLDYGDLIGDKLGNAATIIISQSYDVYGTRLYGEGDGTYHISSDNTVYEGTNLKIGSVKTGAQTHSEEKTFLFFKKGAMKGSLGDLRRLDGNAQDFYTMQSIKGAKKPIKQWITNLYRFLLTLDLLSVLAFAALAICAFVFSVSSSSSSVIKCTPGGVAVPFIAIGCTVVLTVISGVLYYKRIEAYIPTGKGTDNTDFTVHCVVMIAVEVLTVIFEAIMAADNIFGYLLGFLFYPAELACIVYPIVMFVFFGIQSSSFNVRSIEYSAEALTDEEYAELTAIDERLRRLVQKPAEGEIRKAVTMNMPDYWQDGKVEITVRTMYRK